MNRVKTAPEQPLSGLSQIHSRGFKYS